MPTPRKKKDKRKGGSRTPPSSPEDTGKRKNRTFTPKTKAFREPLLEAAANDALDAKAKSGKKRLASEWLKNKVEEFTSKCPILDIRYDDIMNRIRKKEKEAKEAKKAKEANETQKTASGAASSEQQANDEQLSSVGKVEYDQSNREVSPSDTNVSSLTSTSGSVQANIEGAADSLKQAAESIVSTTSSGSCCSYRPCLLGVMQVGPVNCSTEGCTHQAHMPCQLAYRLGKQIVDQTMPPIRCQDCEDDYLSGRESSSSSAPIDETSRGGEVSSEAEDMSRNSSESGSDVFPRKLDASMETVASTQASSEPLSTTNLSPDMMEASTSAATEDASASSTSSPPSLPLHSSEYLFDYSTPVTQEDAAELAYPMRVYPRQNRHLPNFKHQACEIIIRHPSIHTLSITQENFSRLHPHTWLCDEAINFFGKAILMCEREGIYFASTHFLNKLIRFECGSDEEDQEFYKFSRMKRWHRKTANLLGIASIFCLDRLFFPINVNKSHWIFVMADMKLNQIGLWDPYGLNSDNKGYLYVLRRYLYDASVDEGSSETYEQWTQRWSIYDYSDEWPRQDDSSSCGLFIMMGMQRLAHQSELTPTTFTQRDIYKHDVRMRVARLFWNYRLPSAIKSCYAPALPANATRQESATSTSLSAVKHEDNSPPTSGNSTRNKGGRPKNSTIANQLAKDRARKEAVNWVVAQYAEEKRIKEDENKSSKKRVRVANGFRDTLVKQAKERFEIDDEDFDVPLRTIESRIKADRLEVWQPGEVSPIIETEVALTSLIIMAGELKSPLSVGDIIHMANSLIEGTPVAKTLIDWKRKKGMDVDPALPLLGTAWYRGFSARNRQLLEAQNGTKLARRREEQCDYPSFERMYNNVEKGVIASGNGVVLDEPVHMDIDGNVVDDSSAAIGRQTSLMYTRPENCFVFDETGSNTNGTADKRKGGQKKVVGRGQKAQEVTGTKDCHFTVVPVTNLLGELVFVTIIFPGEVFQPSWGIGEDPFVVDVGDDQAASVGPGKRYPGMSVYTVDGKEVPIFFAASTSASMTSTILRNMFAKMDELGITKRGVDENGNNYYPLVILDGHFSRFGLIFLKYVNALLTKWYPVLGVPYGTSYWQLHDFCSQNGLFKGVLYDTKSKFIQRKRLCGLPPEIKKTEIIFVVKSAIEESFCNQRNAQRALAKLGWNPFTRATLDEPDILRSAPPEVQKERQDILALRGVSGSSTGRSTTVVTSRSNLLTKGSGLITASSQEDAADRIASVVADLNWGNDVTSQGIIALAKNAEARQVGREKKEATENAHKSAREIYHDKSKRLTSGLVFANGDGVLNDDLLEATQARIKDNEEKAAAKATTKKMKAHAVKDKVQSVREEIKKDTLVQYKKTRSDGKCPTKKSGLITMLRQTWERTSPCPSPFNSDVDEEDDEEGTVPMDEETYNHYLASVRSRRSAPNNGGGGDDDDNDNTSSSSDDDDGEE